MSELDDPRAWEDDDEPPTRGVWHDAEPDTRERGAKPAPRGGFRIRSDETWARARESATLSRTARDEPSPPLRSGAAGSPGRYAPEDDEREGWA